MHDSASPTHAPCIMHLNLDSHCAPFTSANERTRARTRLFLDTMEIAVAPPLDRDERPARAGDGCSKFRPLPFDAQVRAPDEAASPLCLLGKLPARVRAYEFSFSFSVHSSSWSRRRVRPAWWRRRQTSDTPVQRPGYGADDHHRMLARSTVAARVSQASAAN